MRYAVRQYSEALVEALPSAAGEKRAAALKRFVRLLRRTGDISHLNEIAVQYERMLLAKEGKVKLEVASPEGISRETKRMIEVALGKPVMLIEKTDPKLLAGLSIILNDSLLIDATGRRRLEKLF